MIIRASIGNWQDTTYLTYVWCTCTGFIVYACTLPFGRIINGLDIIICYARQPFGHLIHQATCRGKTVQDGSERGLGNLPNEKNPRSGTSMPAIRPACLLLVA